MVVVICRVFIYYSSIPSSPKFHIAAQESISRTQNIIFIASDRARNRPVLFCCCVENVYPITKTLVGVTSWNRHNNLLEPPSDSHSTRVPPTHDEFTVDRFTHTKTPTYTSLWKTMSQNKNDIILHKPSQDFQSKICQYTTIFDHLCHGQCPLRTTVRYVILCTGVVIKQWSRAPGTQKNFFVGKVL